MAMNIAIMTTGSAIFGAIVSERICISDKGHKYTECLGVTQDWHVCRWPDIMP